MVDVPGNSSTTESISVGGVVTGTLETVGDHDWFRITLTQGQAISILLNGISLEDPFLRIRNANGQILFENDDINSGIVRDSRINFTAPSTGVYYIDAGAWEDGYVGDYQLRVTTYTPPATWTYDQIADQLTTGYWGGTSHRFNVAPGGQLTVNLTGLTAEGRSLALAALATWTDIIGVNFVQVSTGGQIVFDDNEEGAHAESSYSRGFITTSNVNVSTQWIADYGSGLNTYSFQTYIHEIGHALGLGHAGNYNGDASYQNDALYANDSWATTVMSYFSQTENSYFSGLGFARNFVTTPMIADIVAMQDLYGLSATTRTGNTTYGPGWSTSMGALCIFDSGGTDTIDVSSLAGGHRIDLNPGTFSNILGEVGNVSIALGVIIENATGGAGADVILGNSAGNLLIGNGGADQLTGGGGSDTFQGTRAGLNQDTITDFAAGDRIVITDVSLAGFTFNLSGSTLTFSGGSLTLSGPVGGTIVASAAPGGGVQLSIGTAISNDARNDFNGDGRSDVLWRADSGQVTNWLGQASGGFVDNSANASVAVATTWHVEGTGDFNGDGRDDILWRNDNGQMTNWLGQSNGGFANNAAASTSVATSWDIAGVGDFNGDGRDDILWRNSNGSMTNWLGQANGGFANNGAAATAVATSWQIAGIGDFNGDGRDDILWRNDSGQMTNWLSQANGGYSDNSGNASTFVATSWRIDGVGDFNGDGRDDILWRNDSGALTNWLGQANGGFANNLNASTTVATSWQIADVGDFNGDGRDDILWRNSNGDLTNWLGQSNGGFVNNAGASTWVSTQWHVEQPDYLF